VISGRKAGRHAAAATATVAIALAVAVAGCGGSSLAPYTKGGPAPPEDCIKKWNADEQALSLGKHFYAQGHDSRAAHVVNLDIEGTNVKEGCLVVMAARDSDREYGTIGMFTDQTGVWQLISDLPLPSEQKLLEIQATGSKQANCELKDDGSIAPF
jgi:hypothetical protein